MGATKINRHLATLVTLIFPWFVSAAHVTVGDNDWRQLTETKFFTYSQIQSICNPVCSGSLVNSNSETVDFTGWTWANSDDILALVAAYGVPPGFNVAELGSTWAPAFLNDFDTVYAFTSGVTPREKVSGYYYIASSTGSFVAGVNDALDLTGDDVFSFGASNPSSTTSLAIDQGVWLYRATTTVPIPAAGWLLGSALFGLGAARKYRNS